MEAGISHLGLPATHQLVILMEKVTSRGRGWFQRHSLLSTTMSPWFSCCHRAASVLPRSGRLVSTRTEINLEGLVEVAGRA